MRRQTHKFTEVWPSSSQLKLKAMISLLLTLNNWTEKTKMPENTQYTTTSNNNNTNVVVTIIIIIIIIVIIIKLTYTSSITVN